jgi:hypothetical protein
MMKYRTADDIKHLKLDSLGGDLSRKEQAAVTANIFVIVSSLVRPA